MRRSRKQRFKIKIRIERAVFLSYHQTMNILFVCRGNVGRSQMAEELLKKQAGDRFSVTSAGTKVSDAGQSIGELGTLVNEVVTAMNEVGIDISKNVRKQLTEKMVDRADKVILTVDDNDPLPEYVLNNPKVIRWNVLDPKNQSLEFTRNTRDQLDGLIRDFIKNI